jgi:hypothetical protein
MKSEILLKSLQEKYPALKSLVQRFDLELVSNHQRDSIISAKVQQLASTSKLLPRYIHVSSVFQTQQQINQYLHTVIPPPWTYPMTICPFWSVESSYSPARLSGSSSWSSCRSHYTPAHPRLALQQPPARPDLGNRKPTTGGAQPGWKKSSNIMSVSHIWMITN